MINIDIVLLFQAVNFLVLMFLLNILLYKPIRKVLADRKAEIAASKEKTVAVDAEVRQKMDQYEQKLRNVKTEATEERNLMLREARQQEAVVLEAARREAAEGLAGIQAAIRKEAAEAEILLQSQADALSRRICEKVLGRSLS